MRGSETDENSVIKTVTASRATPVTAPFISAAWVNAASFITAAWVRAVSSEPHELLLIGPARTFIDQQGV